MACRWRRRRHKDRTRRRYCRSSAPPRPNSRRRRASAPPRDGTGEGRMRTSPAIEGVDGSLGFLRSFTRYQWLVFFVAWAGWSLDATDFGLFSLVLRPALTELLGGSPSVADIGRV